jgi:hypothetical protein
LKAEGEALVGAVGRDGDRSDARDVIDGVGETNGRRTKNGRERRRARDGNTLSSLCASEGRSRLHGGAAVGSTRSKGSSGIWTGWGKARGIEFDFPRSRTRDRKGRRFEEENKRKPRREEKKREKSSERERAERLEEERERGDRQKQEKVSWEEERTRVVEV